VRVLHVIYQSLPIIGGYTTRAKYLFEAQAASGQRVTVLTSPSQGIDAEDQEITGIKYLRSHYVRWEKQIVFLGGKQLVFGRAINCKLKKLIKGGEFNVIHAHTPFTVALPALKIASKLHIPFVYEKRNLWEESARARNKLSGRWPIYQLAKYMDRWVTHRADMVITITETLRQHTIKMGVAPEKVIVVGNGVDVDTFTPRIPDPALLERCLQGGSFIIGYVGSFFKFEGLPLLLKSFAEVVKVHSGARLVLVGDGEDRKNIEILCRQLGIEDRCLLAGKVLHNKVMDYYSVMDVLVYPRYRSKLTDMISPLKPLESMAMAKAVVVSDVGGMRALVEHGKNGLFFDAGSKDSLSAILKKFVIQPNKAKELGNQARSYVSEHRQWRKIAKKYEDAYKKILPNYFHSSAKAGGLIYNSRNGKCGAP